MYAIPIGATNTNPKTYANPTIHPPTRRYIHEPEEALRKHVHDAVHEHRRVCRQRVRTCTHPSSIRVEV